MPASRHLRSLVIFSALALSAGCGPGTSPQSVPTNPTPPTATDNDPAGQLASRAAAALDRTYIAAYEYIPAGAPARTLTVLVATDGTWRVDVPRGAMSGTADISIVRNAAGLYQCSLGKTATCVKVGTLATTADPKVQHVFVDWLSVLTDRDQAISVGLSRNLAGSAGTCYSVEPSAAALKAPMDAGILCYRDDGTLTAAAFTWGSVKLMADPVQPPPTAPLPGPIVPGKPLPLIAPPTPTPTASASPSASR